MIDQLNAEYQRLSSIKQQAERNLKKAPRGSLRISHRDGNPQFYQRIVDSDSNASNIYLGKQKAGLIQQLAQKDYDQLVLKAIDKRSRAVASAIKKLEPNRTSDAPTNDENPSTYVDLAVIKQIYAGLCDERKQLVVPYDIPDDEYARLWEQKCLERLPHDGYFSHTAVFRTDKGDMVRSKSEAIIADRLYHAGVPYVYELPYFYSADRSSRPDFTALNVRKREVFIWEHFGLMDDPDYRDTAFEKLALYACEGLIPGKGLIVSFETANHPLDIDAVAQNIATFLQ